MQSRALWKRVGSLVAKTVISVLPIIRREYRAKFEPLNKFKQPSRCHNGVVADGCSHSDRRALDDYINQLWQVCTTGWGGRVARCKGPAMASRVQYSAFVSSHRLAPCV